MKGSIQDFSENEGTEPFHILGLEINKEFFEWVESERRGGQTNTQEGVHERQCLRL